MLIIQLQLNTPVMKRIKIYAFVSLKTVFGFALLAVLAIGLIWQTVKIKAASDYAATQANSFQTVKNREISQRIENSPIFDEFDSWTAQYLNANFSDDSRFIQMGENLAAERRELFRKLIQDNPRAAIEKAVSVEIQNRLPHSITLLLEKNVSANGDFNVLAIDDLDSTDERENDHRIEREVVINDSRYKAFVYGRKTSMTTKLDTPIRGVVLDDLIAVDENSVKKIETERFGKNGIVAEVGGKQRYFLSQKEFDRYVRDLSDWEAKIAPSRSEILSPWTEGTKTMLFIRVDFPDRPGVPVDRFGQVLTESFAETLIDNVVNEFYVYNSYGKTSLRAQVTPVVRMPQPQSVYTRENLYALVTDARNAAREKGFDTNNYNLDMVGFSQSSLLNFSGISPIANKGALLNGSFTFKTTAHELGHAFGLMHANLWRTSDGTIIGDGSNVEYGDDFDMMGRGASQNSHFNAGYKYSLNWLTEENVQNVTQSGVYRVYASDTTTPMPQGICALKIKRDETKNYWIEFRQLLTEFPNLTDGALIRWDYPFDGWRQSQILDMNPSTVSLSDSSLSIGKTFIDDANGIKITVLGKGGTTPESLDIKIDFNFSVIKGALFDFDGDNKSDIGVFRPANGTWYLNNSSQGFNAVGFGTVNDIIVPATFDADRKTDIAVYRSGTWYVYNASGNVFTVQFGTSGDVPVPADYDGDGSAEMAVFRPSNGTWYLWNWASQRFSAVQFGTSEDKPVPADYDGDGKTDIAVFRPSSGGWHLLNSNSGYSAVQFGVSIDKPVQADYDGDGKSDIAVYRPSNGSWYLLQSSAGFVGLTWGMLSDLPVPADYDGDGKADITVFRPSNGAWYRLNVTNGSSTTELFGINSDTPVSIGYNR